MLGHSMGGGIALNALVVAPDVRRSVAAVAQRHIPGLTVLSYREVYPTIPFVTHCVIGGQENAA